MSSDIHQATQIGLEMQGRAWRIKHGYENPDNEYCPRCQDFVPHYEEEVEGESVLFCQECHDNGEYPSSLEAWQKHIGKPVKFVDEEAVIEAYTKGTQYPRLFHGTLKEVLSIGIITRHTLYAKIEPRWTDTPKFVPISQVRIVN